MAKSLWEEFKDLFKTEEQHKQDKQESLSDARKREKDIVKQLEELDKQYRDSLPKEEEPDLEELFPSDSGLKEHVYEAETDEEIENRATAKNGADKERDKMKLESEYGEDADKVISKKEEAKRDLAESYDDIETEYSARREDAKDDALRQGVTRGSILSSVLGEINDAKRSDTAAAEQAYAVKTRELDEKLSSLESELSSALEQLDIKYAAELSEDIKKLKEERDKEVEKWEKYNLGVREQQAQYAKEREQNINEYLLERENQKRDRQIQQEQYEQLYGYSGEKQKNYAERYEIAYDFYMSLDPSIALEAFESSPNMQYYLGIYYDKLKKQLRALQRNKYYV